MLSIKDDPYYEKLIEFMTSEPIVAIAIEGNNAIDLVRLINWGNRSLKICSWQHSWRFFHRHHI